MIIDRLKSLGEINSPKYYSSDIPEAYKPIKDMFVKIKEEKEELLLENTELGYMYSVVMVIDFVGDRWCKGRVRYHRVEGDTYAPYTIHYSDIYTAKYKNTVSKNIKIYVKGENPYA